MAYGHDCAWRSDFVGDEAMKQVVIKIVVLLLVYGIGTVVVAVLESVLVYP